MYRNFCFTLNNYTPEQKTTLEKKENVKYIGWAEEVGPSGTPHLQGFCSFIASISISAAAKQLFKAHVEPKKGTFKQARDYFAAPPSDKDQIVVGLVEKGTLPMDQKEKGECPRIQHADAIALAKEGKFDEIDPILQTRYCRTYEHMYEREMRKRKVEDSVEQHEWF
jgi:hypothetical protein